MWRKRRSIRRPEADMTAAAETCVRKMKSRCCPEADRCTHVFEIDGYRLQAEGAGVGTAVRSATFTVGGHEWRISYYPDGLHHGSLSGGGAYASVFLDFMGNQTCPVGTKVSGFVSFDVLSPVTGDPMHVNLVGGRLNFNHTVESPLASNAWGCAKFINRSRMSSYLCGDRLAIECYLSVVVGSRVSSSMSSGGGGGSGPPESDERIPVPPPENLGRLLLLETTKDAAAGGGSGVDVTFKVQGVVFYAHKIVLAARSPVFKAELITYGGGFIAAAAAAGTNKNEEHNHDAAISIQDMEPGVFKALLHFIYTDSVPDDDCDLDDEGFVRHLLVAADRYGMDRMRLMCESMLCKRLCVDNVAATLALADRHYCCKLQDACISFICSSRKRTKDVMGTQGYEHLKKARPSVVMDMLEESVKSSSSS